jgi:hypothetical protein
MVFVFFLAGVIVSGSIGVESLSTQPVEPEV